MYDDKRDIPDIQTVTFEFEDFPLTMESAKFGNYLDKSGPEVRFGDKFPEWEQSATRIEIYGTDGLMLLGVMGGGWQVFGEDGQIRDQEYGYFPDVAHVKNFIDCVRSRKNPNGDLVQGHKSATLIHLANLSYRVGNLQLYYDGTTGKITNSEEANRISEGYYREPYTLPKTI